MKGINEDNSNDIECSKDTNQRYIVVLTVVNTILCFISNLIKLSVLLRVGARTMGGIMQSDLMLVVGSVVVPLIVILMINIVAFIRARKKLALGRGALIIPLAVAFALYITLTSFVI